MGTDQRNELKDLIQTNSHIFLGVPNKMNCLFLPNTGLDSKDRVGNVPDVEVGDATPANQHPYSLNPLKAEFMKEEINYMLKNDTIEPSSSQWSSLCL